MTRLFRRTAAALATACLVSVALSPAEAANAKRGEAIARKNCAPCHAIGPRGDSPNPASPPFRTLAERYDPENLQEALAEGISVGHKGVNDMPEFRLKPTQIEDLIAWLRRVGV